MKMKPPWRRRQPRHAIRIEPDLVPAASVTMVTELPSAALTEPLAEIDRTCQKLDCPKAHRHPSPEDTYSVTGRCGNCGRGVRATFSNGHRYGSGRFGPRCPNCKIQGQVELGLISGS